MKTYLYQVVFTNGTSGPIEVTADSFESAQEKMRNNLGVRSFWTDSRSPHYEQHAEPRFTEPQPNDGPARLSMMLPRVGNRQIN